MTVPSVWLLSQTGNLLVPQEPFELLVRRAIAMLLGPALQCKDCVYEELLKIADQARPREAARWGCLGTEDRAVMQCQVAYGRGP